jgi:hypothetical protein
LNPIKKSSFLPASKSIYTSFKDTIVPSKVSSKNPEFTEYLQISTVGADLLTPTSAKLLTDLNNGLLNSFQSALFVVNIT